MLITGVDIKIFTSPLIQKERSNNAYKLVGVYLSYIGVINNLIKKML